MMTALRLFVVVFAVMAVVGFSAAEEKSTLENQFIKLWVTDGDGGYKIPKKPEYNKLRERLMTRAVLERYASFLSPLNLPTTLWLYAAECPEGLSPHYNLNNHAIVMCYEWLEVTETQADRFTEIAAKYPKVLPLNISREEAVDGQYVSVLLHETGHALHDLLNVPVFGRAEDAADQTAAFIALQFGTETARTIIKGFASLFMLHHNPPTKVSKPNYSKDDDRECRRDPICNYADEHGTAGQRLYNVLCIAYGGNRAGFQDFVDLGWLPPERAKTCEAEYERVKFAFAKTVYPFINQTKMKKVQAMKWLGPGTR